MMSNQPTHQDLADRMNQFDSKLDEILEEFRGIKQSLVQVEKDVQSTKDIVEAWGAVKTAGKFAKWLGSIATGLVAAYLMAKALLQYMIMGK